MTDSEFLDALDVLIRDSSSVGFRWADGPLQNGYSFTMTSKDSVFPPEIRLAIGGKKDLRELLEDVITKYAKDKVVR